MTRADCALIVRQKDAEAERLRVVALWNARRKFRVFDDDITVIGRMIRELRSEVFRDRWRIWQ